MQAGSEVVIQPLATRFWGQPEHVSSLLKTPSFDWKTALRNLAIVWVFAGFGEELGYRGYLLTRAADLGNRSKPAYLAATAYVALLFGFGHFYKGPAGVVDSTCSGLVLGGVYLLSGRNLWASTSNTSTNEIQRCGTVRNPRSVATLLQVSLLHDNVAGRTVLHKQKTPETLSSLQRNLVGPGMSGPYRMQEVLTQPTIPRRRDLPRARPCTAHASPRHNRGWLRAAKAPPQALRPHLRPRS